MRNLLLAAAWLGLFPVVAAAATPFGPLEHGARPRVVLPGGYTRESPANTARPIAMAAEDRIDCVELQIRRSKDGHHLVFDSAKLDGRSSGQGAIREHSLEELRTLDLGTMFASRFADARIMTLPECLDLARQGMLLLLDCQDVDPERLIAEIAAADMTSRVLVSGSADVLAHVETSSQGKIALLARPPASSDVLAWVAAEPAAKNADAVVLAADQATAELTRALHDRKIAVLADACGSAEGPKTWDRLLAACVDFVRTDVPEEFLVHAIASRLPQRTVQIAAHRGALRYAPENTFASLDKAVRMHNDFVEIDVQTTSDGAFFLLHDGTLDRTTNGKGRVRLNTAATLRGLDAGRWFGFPYEDTPIPELDDYLAKFPPQMGLYFDAKDITPEALAAAVARHGLVDRTVVYQGPVYLEKLKAIDPRIRSLAPVGAASHVDTLAKRLKPYAVDTSWKLLSREYIAHCHELGIKVFSDAKGDASVDDYRRAIEWGIDLIQTDHPLKFWRALELSAGGNK